MPRQIDCHDANVMLFYRGFLCGVDLGEAWIKITRNPMMGPMIYLSWNYIATPIENHWETTYPFQQIAGHPDPFEFGFSTGKECNYQHKIKHQEQKNP